MEAVGLGLRGEYCRSDRKVHRNTAKSYSLDCEPQILHSLLSHLSLVYSQLPSIKLVTGHHQM